MKTLSSRERRLVAMLILIAMLGLVWFAVVRPILSGFVERADRRAALQREYQSNQRIVGSVPRLRRQAERQREMLRRFVLLAPGKNEAATMLQDRIQSVVEKAGGEVRSIEDAADTGADVRARVSARLTLAALVAVVERLENGEPFAVVEPLEISADQAAVSGRLDIMEVSFEVSVPLVLAAPR